MKASELRPCDNCGKGLMHTEVPLFYRVSIERMALDFQATRLVQGLLGWLLNTVGPSLSVVPSRAEVALRIGAEPDVLLICEACSLDFENPKVLAEWSELAAHRRILEAAAKEAGE